MHNSYVVFIIGLYMSKLDTNGTDPQHSTSLNSGVDLNTGFTPTASPTPPIVPALTATVSPAPIGFEQPAASLASKMFKLLMTGLEKVQHCGAAVLAGIPPAFGLAHVGGAEDGRLSVFSLLVLAAAGYVGAKFDAGAQKAP